MGGVNVKLKIASTKGVDQYPATVKNMKVFAFTQRVSVSLFVLEIVELSDSSSYVVSRETNTLYCIHCYLRRWQGRNTG